MITPARLLLLALTSACTIPFAHGALAELNVADGTIETPDGTFVGRDFTLIKDFKLELLHRTIAATEGQWVPMAWDRMGRLTVASYNSDILLRLTIPKTGSNDPVKVEKIMNNVGAAEGLVYAFDGLYLNVNRSNIRRHGIYRLTDTNNDDQFDKIEVIRNIRGSGDHGTHNLHLAPDGRSIFMISGNTTPLTDYQSSVVPEVWAEDNLVTRIPLVGQGGNYTPNAWIQRFDRDGKNFNLYAVGMRNPVDFNFNKDGELFVYDSDMEFDMGTPWYIPTNIQHITSGTDVGWRESGRKHPPYYFDIFGTIAVVGSGSPVGVVFGTGAKFPARYQDSMFVADWSYGNLWSVAITPSGASYRGEPTPFISGRPFAVSAMIVNPADGSLLVQTTGTELYRVTYTGSESTVPTKPDTIYAAQRAVRHNLEDIHGRQVTRAVDTVWPFLGDPDRSIRNAARIALEWQDPAQWLDRALNETDPRIGIVALGALARVSGPDEYHRPPDAPPLNKALQSRMLAALERIDFGALPVPDKLDLLRAYQLVFTRLGSPDEASRQRLIARFDPFLPANYRELNWELGELLTYLQAPSAAPKLMALMRTTGTAPVGTFYPLTEYINPLMRARNTPGSAGGMRNAVLARQVDEMQYALLLRTLKAGWTPALREEYLKWFVMASTTYAGGNQYTQAQQIIRADAISQIPEAERAPLRELIDQQLTYLPSQNTTAPAAGGGGARGGAAAPAGAGGGGGGGFGGGGRGTPGLGAPAIDLYTAIVRTPVLNDLELTSVTRMEESFAKENATATAARDAVIRTAFSGPANPPGLAARVQDLANTEYELAIARANAWANLRTEFKSVTPEKINAITTALNNPGTVNGNGRGNAAPPIPRLTPAAR
jgi:hypothetical protein